MKPYKPHKEQINSFRNGRKEILTIITPDSEGRIVKADKFKYLGIKETFTECYGVFYYAP